MADDLDRIAEQHRRLRFDRFDETTAWQLGTLLRERAVGRTAAVAIEVRLHGHTVFFHAMAGTSPSNADWARRKRNVVEMLHQLLAGQATQDGRLVTIEQRLNHDDERFTNIEGRLTSIERKHPEEAA